MSFNFTVNHNEANTFEPIPKGDYEVFISEAEPTTFQTGSEGIRLVFTIRNDVSGQKYGGRKLFRNLVATEKAMVFFHQLSKAVGLPHGQSFNSLEEYARAVRGKALIVTVTHGKDQDGNTREEVKAFKESKVGGQMQIQESNPFTTPTTDALEISDDDLPF